ncbi:hypothetical protein K431DRAFT_348306 [Polychaeton citri CBS 116435]|uniref:Spindle pole body component n=1 Tax=Polychaeton citri CBS 116435 TaxID=1314669 RepID=A0A9P4UNG4_9PEZI|nr:hypothetical protein K431DRAFT_348306 [Polychaeton citri CBS 116435]
MAHSTRSQALTDGLISSVTGVGAENARFKHLRSIAARGLRNQPHARTNQFAVHATYEGLIEKFSILNRDDLAEALQSRWDEMPDRPSQTQPEILSLLLLLSDRPVEKTDVTALDKSHTQHHVAPSLTWQEIVEHDPLTDDDLWTDVQRGYHSSGAEEDPSEDHAVSNLSNSIQATDVEDNPEVLARSYLIRLDTESYDISEQYIHDLHKAQAADETVQLSELNMIRETFSMFQGLPSRLYRCSKGNNISIQENLVLTTATASTVIGQLQCCANVGSAIWSLRQWCQMAHGISHTHVRACQADIQDNLNLFDRDLAGLEYGLLELNVDKVVSILHIATNICILARPLQQLYVRVVRPATSSLTGGYTLLDKLYSTACEAQMHEDNPLFFLCAKLLTNATSVYLRSVATWIHSGSLEQINDSFFTEEANSKDWTLGRMWIERFQLKLTSAPSFLQPMVEQIFALGKSQAFLQELNGRSANSGLHDETSYDRAPFTTWARLKSELVDMPLFPFSEQFGQSLSDWLTTNTGQTNKSLRTQLVRQERVLEFPDMLGHVFHSSDGVQFQLFATALFRRLKGQQTGWYDDFFLTEMAQETLGTCKGVHAASISISVQARPDSANMTSFEMIQQISLHYAMPWPLQNITHEESPTVDAQVLCLLLQAYYAKSLLSQPIPDFRQRSSSSERSMTNTSVLKKCYLDILVTQPSCYVEN